jgi:uncharacterized protein
LDNEKITGLDCTFVALAFLAFISVPSFAAHFNCETAEHPNKKLICANKELSELDDQKTKLFNDLLEHYSSRTKLQETEGQWEKKLLDCGNDFICTKKLYRERIKQLSAMLVEAKKISEWKQNLILTLAGTLQSPPPPPVASMRAAPEAPLRCSA